MRKLKPRAERVPGAERTWCFDADRVKIKSGPPFTPTQFDENLKSTLMKKAVIELGVDPVYHGVTLEPHQLIIYDKVIGNNSFTHNFEAKPGNFSSTLFVSTYNKRCQIYK